jgi:hypothetical protein
VNVASTIYHGAKNLLEWHEDGFEPVPADVSQARADICSGRLNGHPCSFNQNPTFKLPDFVADIVMAQFEKKNGFKATVKGEENINVCMVCKCLLKLKVWEPMDLILNHTTEEQLQDFKNKAPWCWINQTPA